MAEKKIKNQAWIHNEVVTTLKDETDPKKGYSYEKKGKGTSLKQEIITITEEGNHCTSVTETVDLIKDIWDNLKGQAANTDDLSSENIPPMDGENGEQSYCKNAKGNFFFWKYKMTGIEDGEVGSDITVKLECPQPTYEDLVEMGVEGFSKNEKGEIDFPDAATMRELAENTVSDYLKYWLGVFATAAENAEDKYTIQKSKINYPKADMRAYSENNTLKKYKDDGTIGEDPTPVGDAGVIEEKNVQNNDLASLANLLSLF